MQTLINKYEMLNLKLTKKKTSNYQFTNIKNDVGYIYQRVLESSFLSLSNTQSDFTFKDEDNQDLLYSHYIYLGNKADTYYRSYTKLKDVMAAVGGLSRIFTFFFYMLYNLNTNMYRNFLLINKITADDEDMKNLIIKNYDENNYRNNSINNNLKNESGLICNTLTQKLPNPLIFPIHKRLSHKNPQRNLSHITQINQKGQNNTSNTNIITKYKPSCIESCVYKLCCFQYNKNSKKFFDFYSTFKDMYIERLDILNYFKIIEDVKIVKNKVFGLENGKSIEEYKSTTNNKKSLFMANESSVNEINQINEVTSQLFRRNNIVMNDIK